MFNYKRIIAGLTAIACLLMVAPAAQASGNISLRTSVEKTLAYNPTVKSFQEYRQAAEYDLKRARSGWFPSIDARAGFGAERWNDSTTRKATGTAQNRNTYYDRTTANVTISQVIWDGMATWHRVTLSEQRLDSAQSRLFDNVEALSLDAILAHIEVYRQTKMLQLAALNVNNHKRILASQQERQRSGASTMADVTQIQSRLARTLASEAETRAALEISIANYQRLTGTLPGGIDAPNAPASPYASLNDALTRSQTGNLKIQALRTDVDATETQVKLDWAPFQPTITLDAAQDYNWRVQSSDTYSWGNSLTLNLSWNLFRGGYDWYNVKGDKARSRQARHELNAQMDAVAEETTATWSSLISAREQERYFTDGVEFSTRTRDMYLEQFNVGQRSLLDVLDSENEVYSSAIQLVTAQQNVIAAQYRLLALGGDLLASFDIDRTTVAIDTEENIRTDW